MLFIQVVEISSMILQILLAVITGILLGIITGLTPGIHINLISVLILQLSPILFIYFQPITLCTIIVAMAITHTFLDTIPSIFLGAPDSEVVLSILPGHKFLLQGKGYEAVFLTIIGSLCSLLISILAIPIFFISVETFYPLIIPFIGYSLIILSVYLIVSETKSILWAAIIFILSGVFGIAVFNLNIENPLFPMLSGMFGTSMLFLSYNQKVILPKQIISTPEVGPRIGIFSLLFAVIAGSLCSFLPGLGPSQAAVVFSQFNKSIGDKGFLILVGGISTVNMVLSFVAYYLLNKPRNGAVVVISKLLGNLTFNNFLIFISTSLIAAAIATLITIKLSKIFSNILSRVNYKYLCLTIILTIILLVLVLTKFTGFFILLISSSIGILPQLKGVKRSQMMGCLILPVILYYLF